MVMLPVGDIQDMVRTHPNISFKTLGMGYYHGCGIDSENNIHCWGYEWQTAVNRQ